MERGRGSRGDRRGVNSGIRSGWGWSLEGQARESEVKPTAKAKIEDHGE